MGKNSKRFDHQFDCIGNNLYGDKLENIALNVELSIKSSSKSSGGFQGFFPPELTGDDSVLGEMQEDKNFPPELTGDGSVLGEMQENQNFPPELTGDDSVLGETEPPATIPLKPKRLASGWLEPYTKNKKLKSGLIATYPRVEAKRDPDNPKHWYWAYKWEEKNSNAKSANGFVSRAVNVPVVKVEAVKTAIAFRWPVKKVLQYLRDELIE